MKIIHMFLAAALLASGFVAVQGMLKLKEVKEEETTEFTPLTPRKTLGERIKGIPGAIGSGIATGAKAVGKGIGEGAVWTARTAWKGVKLPFWLGYKTITGTKNQLELLYAALRSYMINAIPASEKFNLEAAITPAEGTSALEGFFKKYNINATIDAENKEDRLTTIQIATNIALLATATPKVDISPLIEKIKWLIKEGANPRINFTGTQDNDIYTQLLDHMRECIGVELEEEKEILIPSIKKGFKEGFEKRLENLKQIATALGFDAEELVRAAEQKTLAGALGPSRLSRIWKKTKTYAMYPFVVTYKWLKKKPII